MNQASPQQNINRNRVSPASRVADTGNRNHHHALHSSQVMKKNLILSAIACVFPNVAWALPESGQVVAGSATISSPDANTTLINQTTDQSIINWTRFNIGSDEFVQFIQPSSSSISLNRVTGGDPSSILGSLSANGHVYLVNPNGIYFGHGVQVDVSGLVASVMDIDNADFMSGNFVFSRDPNTPAGASVINDGVITARDNGYVVLMGDYAANNGIIQAHMGKVVLASGSHVTMDVSGGNLVSVAVDEATLTELAGVDNTGEIYADGGRVIMTAKVAGDLIGSAVNNTGLIQANSIVESNGEIYLTASGGDITNAGTLDASAEEGSGLAGGSVFIYSDRDVTLAEGSVIEAKGDSAVTINSVRNKDKGRGGVVRAIAEGFLNHESGAVIDVSGAERSGGFVELSGHGSLAIRGDVNLGSGGSILIDPAVLNIQNDASPPGVSTSSTYVVGDGFIESQLNLNNDVTLVASNSVNAFGTFSINATGTGDLAVKIGTLTPGAGSLGGTPFNCGIAGFCSGGTSYVFTSGASGSINFGNVSVNIAGGLTLAGGTASGDVNIGGINAGGNVSLTAGGNVTVSGLVGSAGTSFFASAGNDINLNGDLGSSVSTPLNADVTLRADNDININGNILLGNNSLVLAADDDTNALGDVNIVGSYGSSKTVSTLGNLNVSGNNFIVKGASGTSFAADSQVDVQASNINVTLSGDMSVSGGIFPPTSAVSSGVVDVSVVVKALNAINISANTLNVKGGNVDGSTSFGGGNLTVNGNAELEAGGDLSLTLTGDLNIIGGTVSASGIDDSPNINANANAVVKSNTGDVLINNVGGAVNVTGGIALATRSNGFSASCLSGSCLVNANAIATLAAVSGNVVINTVGTSLTVNGGTATANGSTFSMTYVATAAAVTANANADISGNQIIINNVGGSLAVAGGTAAAYASHSVGTGITPVLETATANANAGLMATQNVQIGTVGGNLSVSGGNATARATRSCDSGTCIAAANANADVTAQSLTVSSVTGNVAVNGGFANAAAGNGASNAQADANANALITVSQDIDITAAGSISVWGSSANATAIEDVVSNNTMNAAATGGLNAGQNVTLDAGGSINVFSGFANAGGSWSTANNIIATADVAGSVIAGNNISLTTATELNVFGGFADAAPSITGAVTGSASADASATVSAGGLATINVLSGSMFVFDGSASQGTAPGPTYNATAEGVVTAGNLNANINGNLNVISSGSLIAAGSMDISASGINDNTTATYIAGTSLAVSVLGNYNVLGNYSAGTALSFAAGGTLDVNIDLGSSGARLNNDVTLGGRVINTHRDIYLGNNVLTLNGVGGTGTINIANSGTNRQAVVSTQGALSVTGNNLVVQNTLTGISGTTFSSVGVDAATVNVAITGNMDISAGTFLSLGAGSPVSVDASVKASGNISISAQNLNLNAGDVSVTASGGGSPNPVTANAALEAGGNLTVNATGSVNVAAGNAFANAPGTTSTAAAAQANARMAAGGNIDVSAGTIALSNGTAFSAGNGTVSASAVAELDVGGTSLVMSATNDITLGAQLGTSASRLNADVTLSAGNNLDIDNNIYLANRTLNLEADNDTNGVGDVNISGMAGQAVNVSTQSAMNISGQNLNITGATSAGFTGTSQVFVSADDGNAMTTIDNITVNLAGDMNVAAGAGNAVFGDGTLLLADVSVNVSAGNDIIINAGGSLNISGGDANANFSGGGVTLTSRANASVSAGGNVVATLGGNLNVNGGAADASAFTGVTSGIADVEANAELAAGGTLTVDAAGSIAVTPGTTMLNVPPAVTAVLSANAGIKSQGNMSLTAGTSLTLNGEVDVGGSNLVLTAGTDLTINTDLGIAGSTPGKTLNASIPLNADTALTAGNNIFINGNIFTASNSLSAVAGADIVSNLAQIYAAGLYMQAGGNIDLSSSMLNIGSGSVAGIAGDALVLQAMQASGIPVPTNTSPNARFIAGGSLDLGDIALQGASSYLWLSASNTSVNSITTPGGADLLLQYSPSNPNSTIGFEDLPDTSKDVNYNNQQHVFPFPITTLVIGSSEHAGNITIGSLEMIDIGDKNIVAVSDGGSIDSLANVITTGIVAGLGQAVFVTPRLENLLVDVDDPLFIIDDESRKKLISMVDDDDSNVQMCTGQ